MQQILGLRPGFVSENVGIIKNDISTRNKGIVREQHYWAQPAKRSQTENDRKSSKKWRIFTRGAKAKAWNKWGVKQ